MRLAYVILTAVSLFLAFLIMTHLETGMRELLSISWVVMGIYCMTRFAWSDKPKDTSASRQQSYRRMLEGRSPQRRRADRE